jgi:Arc/MetJ-type ribon-helix-helix transcriptional regulator
LWVHIGMSTQIAVRLPDDMVKFVDYLVETGRGSSRAMVITRALERERRHEMAVQDAAIYARRSLSHRVRSGPPPSDCPGNHEFQ